MSYQSPDSPLFHWLNDSWDHGASPRDTKRIAFAALRGRYAHVLGCMAAGLCGGVLMALLDSGVAIWDGRSFLAPFYRIDSLFLGFFSLAFGSTSAAAIGFLIHMCFSAVFGGIFSIFLRAYTDEKSALDALFGGLAYGVLIWGLTSYGFIMRWSDSSLDQEMSMVPDLWFFSHMLFGATQCLAPWFTKVIQKRSRQPFDEPYARGSRAA